MAIIVVSNLKGGVGKTALSVNTSHALAKRGCETLLIDIDPQNAVNRLLGRTEVDSPRSDGSNGRSLVETCLEQIAEVRNGLYTLSLSALVEKLPLAAGSEEAALIGNLIEELAVRYDFVVVDTPPIWNGALEAALDAASLLLIPVDPSVMAVEAAIDLLNKADLAPDVQCILQRTMVSRQAKRVARVSAKHLAERFPSFCESTPDKEETLPQKVGLKGVSSWGSDGLSLYQSQIIIPRSEQVHRLGFMQQSVFDTNYIPALQDAYRELARQLETVLASFEEEVEEDNSFLDALSL